MKTKIDFISCALSSMMIFGLLITTACGGGNTTSSSNLPQRATLAITTNNLPTGNVGADYLFSICATGGTGANDNWTAGAGLPPGLTLQPGGGPDCAGPNTTGQLFGTPTQKGTFSFSVTATDTTGASVTKMFSLTIGAPLPITITTTSALLCCGQVNVPYGPAGLMAAGGVKPYSWRFVNGPLPSGMRFDNLGNLSGTPSEFGNFSFTVQVSDSETPAMSSTATLNFTVHTLLFGPYAFLFRGFDANGAVVAAGSFTADGFGAISAGVEDVNRHVAGPVTNASLTGNYSVGLDDRGTLTLTSSAGTSTFAFALNYGGATRFIELDSSGTRGSGEMSPSPGPGSPGCVHLGDPGETISYVLGMSGDDLNRGRVALAGNVQSDGAGNLTGGTLDENDAGTLSSNVAWTGTDAAPAGSSRCTMTLTMAGSASRNFALYPSSDPFPENYFLVEVDPVASGVPLVAGKAVAVAADGAAPAGSLFTNASLKSPIVGGLTGFSPDLHASDVSLVFFSPDGNGNVSITEDENNGGVITTGKVLAGTYDVSGTGRVSLTAGPNPPVLYLVSQGQAFVMGTDNRASFGLLEQELEAPDGNITVGIGDSNFRLATEEAASVKVSELSGLVSFNGAGTLMGTSDESTPSRNTTGQSLHGDYSLTNTPASGQGSLTLQTAGRSAATFIFLSEAAEQCVQYGPWNGRYRPCISWSAPVATRLIAIPSDTTETDPAVLVIE